MRNTSFTGNQYSVYQNLRRFIKPTTSLEIEKLKDLHDNIIIFKVEDNDSPEYPDWSHRLVDSNPVGSFQFEEWRTKYKNNWYRIGVIINDHDETFMFNAFLQRIGGGDPIIREANDNHPYANATYWKDNIENILMEESL